MKNLIRILTMVAVLPIGWTALAEEEPVNKEEPVKTEEEAAAPVKKKKPPKKQAIYTSWAAAAAASEAWEQPIIAFLELDGDKNSAKIKKLTVDNPVFAKEFIPNNCIYYHAKVLSMPEDRTKKDSPLKPNFTDFKSPDKSKICILASGNAEGHGNPSLPMIVLTDHSCRQINPALCPLPEDACLSEFVENIKSAFETANFSVTITKKLESAIEKEKKAIAKEKKRQEKEAAKKKK